ncbi:phosphatase PAP2 family protein [Streptomyces cavernicola]|uniref:Phosphatase PAP2 family protein n=1 Tax=Streptomyces cavernicola TaxID=3043613 RepID=A0ABT6S4Y2_9ACTN|nr:phosphatase PAP2 family protein [Streptomyces sp. B-S-A6]MDI3403159.1 phosphatase PAP2 family protein [Streptomyces sp. B-S-A6]
MGETNVSTREGWTAAGASPLDAEAEARPAGTFVRRLRTPRRPRLWYELALIAVSYWLYSLVRNAVPEQRAAAMRNADWIWQAEQTLGLAFEHAVNRTVNSVEWLVVGMNYYYATLHFIVTIGVLVWLYRRHPGRYAAMRSVLFLTTGLALVGFYFFPLAPPRLFDGGFVDTVLVHETWGSMASGDLKHMTNQYAAMPSMHIGWSLWCGLALFTLSRVRWVRVLAVLYPMATLVVIIATANHFWLDAVGGLLCLVAALAATHLWYGAAPYRLPRLATPVNLPHPAPSRKPAAASGVPDRGAGNCAPSHDGAAPEKQPTAVFREGAGRGSNPARRRG